VLGGGLDEPDADPQFVDPGLADERLQDASGADVAGGSVFGTGQDLVADLGSLHRPEWANFRPTTKDRDRCVGSFAGMS
jgi:hypothetical protein